MKHFLQGQGQFRKTAELDAPEAPLQGLGRGAWLDQVNAKSQRSCFTSCKLVVFLVQCQEIYTFTVGIQEGADNE